MSLDLLSLSSFLVPCNEDSVEEAKILAVQLVRFSVLLLDDVKPDLNTVLSLHPCYKLANLPEDTLHRLASVTTTGIYFGYAQVSPPPDQPDALNEEERKVHPMVMSLGWNPYYKNEKMTAVRFAIYFLV